MTLRRALAVSLTLLATSAVLATGCASDTAPGSPPVAYDTTVLGLGTVIQVGDSPAELCLGGVAESYPPQCSGPELVDWDWASIEGYESANDVTWGAYAVWGRWDGTRLLVTDIALLALYDPLPIVDPLVDPANRGTTPDVELTSVQDTIHTDAPVEILAS